MLRASRSFSLYPAASADKRTADSEKAIHTSSRRKSSSKHSIIVDSKSDKKMAFLPGATARPMVIPSGSLRLTSDRSAKQASSLPARKKQDGMTPAMAAVLSSTAIPRRRGSVPRKSNPLSAVVEDVDREKAIESSRTALDLLLGPPEEGDHDFDPVAKSIPASPRVVFLRKHSSDSIPSLDTDDEESISSSSIPSTPRSGACTRKLSLTDRRKQHLSSPPSESCLSDHPLLFASVDPGTEISTMLSGSETELQPALDSQLQPKKRKTSLKSNLTASLRVLKSAAKSFSSLYPPLTHPDDFLTRSILSISPQFTDEKRPVLFDDAPTPALRRYLNPSPATESKSMLNRRATALGLDTAEDCCTASIQLETYRVSKLAKKAVSTVGKPPASSAPTPSSPLLVGPAGRQREVRENSDFLRVIVLEMNMRRQGKLSEYMHGKARFVLPPRQASVRKDAAVDLASSVPSRWIALVHNTDDSSDSSDTDTDSDDD